MTTPRHLSVLAILTAASACVTEPGDPVDERSLALEVEEEPDRIDQTVAKIELENGALRFVDEEPESDAGVISYWEYGNIDLTPFFDENATALEIYLAFAGDESDVPERLIANHDAMSEQNPAVPKLPRDVGAFVNPLALTPDAWAPESYNGKNCWGWGGTSSQYNAHVGYQSFSLNTFRDNLINNYFQIGSGFSTTTGTAWHEGQTGESDSTETVFGAERSMGLCVASALAQPGEEDLCEDFNLVKIRADVYYQTSGTGTWNCADCTVNNTITSFGNGGRFRSNATTGGTARKYKIEIQYQTPAGEDSNAQILCWDQIGIAWRSKLGLS